MGKSTSNHKAIERHGSGFSVLECLVVISILAILLVQGVPALREYGQRQRMSAAMHALHSHLAMARNDAVRFNVEMVICPGEKTSGCRNDSAWDSGWLIFEDLNGDRAYQSGERLLATEPGLENIMVRSTTGRRYLRFVPNGSSPGSNSSISFCDLRGAVAARKLVISNLGRIRREP
ncbi:MAG TPA: GspH/FimT family pseudopilin, partial [Xanthomonadales bacterium]|nr:GspH/FimT family pseudopilin [Xanthomonadales bacterium]